MKKRILSLVLCAAMLLSMCLFLGAGVMDDTTADGSAESPETVVSTSGAPEFQGVGPFMTYFPGSSTVRKAPMLRTAANGTSDGSSDAVEVDKTATATGKKDADGNPIYRIDLNAEAKSNIVTKSQPCDIVLVLDRSGSMEGENVTALIKAVNVFLKTVQENSSKSRVAIVSYASDESSHGGAVSVDSGSKSADAGAFVPITQNGAVNSELTKIVEELAKRCDGGTQSGKGLQQAVKIFSDVKETVEDKTVGQKVKNPNYNNTRVTILFTDGQPGNNNNGYKCYKIHDHWADKENGYDVAQQSIHWSTILKAPKNGTVKLSANQNFYRNPYGCEYGVSNPDDFHFGQSWNGCGSTVYCVGLNLPSSHEGIFSGTDTATDGSKVNEYLYRVSSHRRDGSHVTANTIQNDWESGKDWNKTYKDDWTRNREKGYYLVGDQSQLSRIFTEIAEQAGTEVKDVTIRDEISESFVPCAADGTPYKVGDKIAAGEYSGTVRQDDTNGNYYIEWTKVTLKPAEADPGTKEPIQGTEKTFSGTLYVKPRDGFLGGNNVPTNGKNSGVYTADNNQIKPFPQPEVNVPVDSNAFEDQVKNIYYGNAAPTLPELSTATPLEPWQTRYVKITYESNSTDISNTADGTYTVTVTITPGEAKETSAGTPATEKTASVTSKVNVYKPEITFKDSIIDYNTTPDYEKDNLGVIVWKHEGTAAASANMTGAAPTLTYTYDPAKSALTEDTGVKVTVKIGDRDITADAVMFRHDPCTFPGCKYTDDCGYQFYVHINVFDLTIVKAAADDSTKIDENQTFVFRVQGEGVDMQVVITGPNKQVIKNLPVGEYTITEDTSWSWKYTPVGDAEKTLTTSDIKNGAATVTFVNENKGTNWLTSLAKVINTWAGGSAHEK